MAELLVLVEFVCSEDGETPFREHLPRTLDEVRSIEGCLQAHAWQRPDRCYLFYTLWRDNDALDGWMENTFHREELMPSFRQWCTEAQFSFYDMTDDHERVRKCTSCGRWSRGSPGWDITLPNVCRNCGAPLADPGGIPGVPGYAG